MNLLAVQGDIAREVSQRLRSQLSAEDCAHQRNADALGFVVSQAVVILFRESEIQQLYNPARGREDVRWFEVAMKDSLIVRIFNGTCDFGHYKNASARLLAQCGAGCAKISPGSEFHGEKGNSVIAFTDVVHGNDIRVIERGCCFCFSPETGKRLQRI